MEGLGLSLERQTLIRETDEKIDYEFESYAKLRTLNDSFYDDILEQLQKPTRGYRGYNSKEDFLDEFMIVLSGKVEYEIEGDLHLLVPGSFYMLQPGSTEHITQVVEECTILAVRLPSIPNNKIMVDKKDD